MFICHKRLHFLCIFLIFFPLATHQTDEDSFENFERPPDLKLICQNGRDDAVLCRQAVSNWLSKINSQALGFNIITADFAWDVSVNPEDERLAGRGAEIDKMRTKWRRKICEAVEEDIDLNVLEASQSRQFYLLCRGATFTAEESESLSEVLDELQTIYTTSKICIPLKSNGSEKTEDHESMIVQYLSDVEGELAKQNGLRNQESDDLTKYTRELEFYNMIALKNAKLKPRYYDVLLLNNKFDESIGKNDDFSDASLTDAVRSCAVMAAGSEFSRQQEVTCLSGEPDLERLMAASRNEKVLRFAWLAWREKVGPPMRPFYQQMVQIKNSAAVRSGYSDVGQVWREELEIPNLKMLVEKLYYDVRSLYEALHGVARYFLRKKYGDEVVKPRGHIPAHLLGNMWAQNWERILDVILPEAKDLDLDRIIRKTNWTTHDMLKRAEDFYTSIGFKPMTQKFWQYSYFGEKQDGSNTQNGSRSREAKCHGTAANMFKENDFRMIYCAGLSMEDFYVIHHEMGHIEYYMSYDRSLPTIFKDGANSAFQESVGDAIMLAVVTPQHLQRLGLINDQSLYTYPHKNHHSQITNRKYKKNRKASVKIEIPENIQTVKKSGNDRKVDFDSVLLLRQALTKLPQIPFGFLIDMYRWDIFSGKITPENYNKEYWKYVRQYQGVEPPNGEYRGEEYFDAGAKFHVPDNTPYVRYFLSSFLQVDIFKAMCKWSLFGETFSDDVKIPMPLHRCDIYGAKKAGDKLKEFMSFGSSNHWSLTLKLLTGSSAITSQALLEYFEPLKEILDNLILEYNIPVGW